MRSGWVLGVTGTPGTGKKSVSPSLAGSLGFRLVDLNAVALAGRAAGSREVDVRRLRRSLLQFEGKPAVVFGHLLPDVLTAEETSFVAVLRCEPAVLKRRLLARGYPAGKVLENVEAELIGVVLDGALRRFGRGSVREYDATRAASSSIAERIAADYASKRRQSAPWTDWTLRYGSPVRLRSLLSTASTEPAST